MRHRTRKKNLWFLFLHWLQNHLFFSAVNVFLGGGVNILFRVTSVTSTGCPSHKEIGSPRACRFLLYPEAYAFLLYSAFGWRFYNSQSCFFLSNAALFPALVAFPAMLHNGSPAATFPWVLTRKADSTASLHTDSSAGICNFKRHFQTLSWSMNLPKGKVFKLS